jgi:DNA-binding MarR family transcriptional regulator
MATRTKTKSELAAELGNSLLRIAKSAKRSIRAELEEMGVTVPQALTIQHLAAAGGRLTLRQIGQECDMLASTATGVVDRLEQHGYVRRERDRDDRRVVWVQLTEEGAALQSRLPAFGTRIGSAFTVLSVSELEQLLDALRRIQVVTEEEGGR